jgi:hypothetical protein
MGMKTRAAAAVLAVAMAAGCGRFGGGSGGGAGATGGRGQETQAAREDSARATAKALQDSGVSVDTQTIDTGTAATARADDN